MSAAAQSAMIAARFNAASLESSPPMSEVVWESLYQRAIEHLTLTEEDDGVHAESVIGAEQFGLRYSIDCDARWNFQRAEIVCGPRRIDFQRDGRDWRVNAKLPDDPRASTHSDL